MIFRFESPWFLMLLLLLPLLAAWPVLAKRWSRPSGLRYADVRLAAKPTRSWRIALRPALNVLRIVALALVILAVARPQTGQAREIIKGEGVDIALALDISGSMASLDFEPQNRLEAAKDVIADFVQKRPYDQVGLVVLTFARHVPHISIVRPATAAKPSPKECVEKIRKVPSLEISP